MDGRDMTGSTDYARGFLDAVLLVSDLMDRGMAGEEDSGEQEVREHLAHLERWSLHLLTDALAEEHGVDR